MSEMHTQAASLSSKLLIPFVNAALFGLTLAISPKVKLLRVAETQVERDIL